MINDDICKLRDKLNSAIKQNKSYEEIYKLSTQLDMLIIQYYKEYVKNKKKE
jgi:hypothetical protein